jgi:1,4-dihydroxy-2-naphthoyl-CoA hydrolase
VSGDTPTRARRLESLRTAAARGLVGLLGIDVLDGDGPVVVARMQVHEGLMAPNGFLHGGSIVALADTACGFGCWLTLPDDAPGFTTVELKTNFIGAPAEGILRCDARLVHAGRSTQVWDAEVARDDGRPVALFRCTQLLLDHSGPPRPLLQVA